MALTRRIARPLLASVFIADGIDSIRNPESRAKAAQAVTVPLARRFPALPDDPELLVQLNGAVQVGAGVLLAVGRFRRLAALALIASIVPTTYAAHRFWEEDDEDLRAEQRVHFLKNLGLLGGLVLAAVDTEGAPSLGWRAHRRAARIGAAVAVGKAAGSNSASSTGSSAADGAVVIAHHARDAAAEVGRTSMAAPHAPRPVRRTWPYGPPGRPTWPDGSSPTPCPVRVSSWRPSWKVPEPEPRTPSPGSPMWEPTP